MFSRQNSAGTIFLLACLFIACMVSNANAQCEEYAHVNSSVTADGECVCGVTSSVSSSCDSGVSSEEFRRMIYELDDQITEIHTELITVRATVAYQEETIIAMNEQMTTIHATKQSIIDKGIVISRPEYDIIRNDLRDMELLINELEAMNASQSIINELRAEIANITINLDKLEANNDADVESLLRDIAELERKLAECEANRDPGSDDGFRYPWENNPKGDSCKTIVGLSEPYTVRGNLAQTGVWFRDPYTKSPKDEDRPWYQSGNTRSSTIQRYLSMDAFLNSQTTNYQSFTPASNLEGTSVVAYNGSLYYVYSNSMKRYDYTRGEIANQRTLSGAGTTSSYPYLYGGYSSIDFAVDEKGLWVIYGKTSNSGLMSVSKIDPITLEVLDTYDTQTPKRNYGECFMVCAKLYCTDSHNKHDGKVIRVFETTTGETDILDVEFNSKYLLNTALKYNPNDQLLYAFNNGHAVMYSIKFGDVNSNGGIL